MSEEDGLNRFLSLAADHRLLSAHEEKALGRRVQAGMISEDPVKLTPDGASARNELVLCNIRLVVSVARYYRNRGLPMADVVQEGIKGLNRAAEKFDPKRGIRFSTYATLWIKQAIQRGLSSSGTAIRLPSSVAASRAKVRAAQARYPDADHVFLADLLDLDVKDVERALDAAEVVTSLDREHTTDEHTHTLLDAMPWVDEYGIPIDPYETVGDDISDDITAALNALEKSGKRGRGKLRRRVIEMHFGLTGKPPMTVEEIRPRINVMTVNTVKTLRAEAIAFLGERLEQHR